MRTERPPLETMFRRLGLPKRCIGIRRQNLAKQATSKCNTQERRELSRPRANVKPLGVESLVTKQRLQKEQLSEVLQSQVTTIQEALSSVAQAYYDF
jgi:hypothetical protein